MAEPARDVPALATGRTRAQLLAYLRSLTRPKSAWATFEHRGRRAVLQSARLAAWWLAPHRWPVPRAFDADRDGALDVELAAVRVPLARSDGIAEAAFEHGKRRNVALAVPAFDGLVLSPERPLSFWRTLGRTGEGRGYTWGMELRGGCVVPAIAGGVCLLSNALFEVAARAGFRIIERHGHSLEAIPPAPGTIPLDATVAWPDVDLVIAPREGRARIAARLEGDTLSVTAYGARPLGRRIELRADERVEHRGFDRVRHIRVLRRELGSDGALVAEEQIAESTRRILTDRELGKSCMTCGEHACRDRPREPVLIALRRLERP